MELTDALFLGGYKSNFENELISPTVWTGRLLQGFVGCVKDFYLNHNIIDLVQYAKKQDSGKFYENILQFLRNRLF